jgi:hypothetical protein
MTKMTCEAVRDALLAGRPPADPELAEHAATCTSCRALLEDHGSLGLVLAAPDAEPAQAAPTWSDMALLVEHEVGWRAWLRSRPTPWRRAFGVAGFALVTALGVRHLRADFALVPALEIAGLLAAFAVTGIVALRHAVTVKGSARANPARGMLALAFAVPFILAFVRTATLTPNAPNGATFVRQALGCFVYGSLLTAPLVALLWLLDRGAPSRTQSLLSAAIAGLAANAALTLHCSLGESAHVLAGHAGIGLGLAAIVWLLGRETKATSR